MSPSQAHSQPSPNLADGAYAMHDALADPLPFGMQDISLRPVGCLGLARREFISPIMIARASWTWSGLVKMGGIR